MCHYALLQTHTVTFQAKIAWEVPLLACINPISHWSHGASGVNCHLRGSREKSGAQIAQNFIFALLSVPIRSPLWHRGNDRHGLNLRLTDSKGASHTILWLEFWMIIWVMTLFLKICRNFLTALIIALETFLGLFIPEKYYQVAINDSEEDFRLNFLVVYPPPTVILIMQE